MNVTKNIRSVEDLNKILSPQTRVLTLFSGGLDSAYLLYLLSQKNCAEVVALTFDLGDDINYPFLEQLARKFGVRLIVLDRKNEFAESFVAPAIAAPSLYLGLHPISSSLSRPLMAKEAVHLANQLNCDVLLHTANQSQNSLRRLNGAIYDLGYKGYYGTPYENTVLTRNEKTEILRQNGVDFFTKRNYSGDSNVWCREFESGLLDDPEKFSTPEMLYRWSASTQSQEPVKLSLTYERGIPVAVNGTRMPLLEIIEFLNSHAGAYGLGRYSGLEHLVGGQKVLEVREMPAAAILLHAYRQLETACVSAETSREKINVEQMWIREAVEGRWFGLLREASQNFIARVSEHVNGIIDYKLNWRTLEVTSIRADKPLYLRDRDAWEKEAVTQQLLAPSYI